MRWEDYFELVEVNRWEGGGHIYVGQIGGDPDMGRTYPTYYRIRDRATRQLLPYAKTTEYTMKYVAERHFKELENDFEQILLVNK